MEENNNKKEYKKVNNGEGRPHKVMTKEDSKRMTIDVILGIILLIVSYGVTMTLINMGVSWLTIAVVVLLIFNGIFVVRGFRRKRYIMAVFGLAYLAPVLFLMLVAGACGLLFRNF